MEGSLRVGFQCATRSLGQHPTDVSSNSYQLEYNDVGSNHNEEQHNEDEQPKNEKSRESSSINVKVLKGIQAQIASLAQRDMTHPYTLEWDSVSYPPKFKPPMLHTHDGKISPNQHIYYFLSQTGNVIDNNVGPKAFHSSFDDD